MAYLQFDHIAILGVSAAVPKNTIDNKEWLEYKGVFSSIESMYNNCGIKERRISYTKTGLDLSFCAADRLLEDLNWDRKDVDALITITSFPDYIMPNNACILQERLGLDSHCYAHDIAVESTGWIYGLSAVASLMQNGDIKKAILLTGIGRIKLENNAQDFMYGHAATATAIEFDEEKSAPVKFYFGTDASNAENIWVNQYGMRLGRDKSRLKHRDYQGDELFNLESCIDIEAEHSFIENGNVKAIQSIQNHYGIPLEKIDYFVLQQNSEHQISSVKNRLNLPQEKISSNVSHYGNTGASSIPLTIVSNLKNKLVGKNFRLMCSACGDFSISAVSFELSDVTISNLIEVEE